MSPTWKSDCGRVVLYCADCREVLPTLADESVEMVFAKLLRRYGLDCPQAAALWRSAGQDSHILKHADMVDIEVFRDAGLLPPNIEVTR